ncbi:LysE family translocator [Kurthia sibirica]|uniref:Lysine transporter LysE n=1 Tax=Kurthia sibirica TaxID=202750 RepID=A0A2U3APK2_9BACL|nr:LysE family translocator [Kurthia sibirica]PWI26478.1 hypothetical protein DEX24_03875 [Kurthia sibirica]GEK33047.1 lysine transporter LysE [Kurthia sibirica]
MLSHFLLFSITSFLLIIVPGPDTAVTTRNTLLHGRKGGIQTTIGTCLAISIHTTAAAIGLSAIIMKSALAFSIFKYLGAAYLLFMGYKAFRAMRQQKPLPQVAEASETPYSKKSLIAQGFYTNILNPKVAVFFLTFFPQFVLPHTNTTLSFLGLGLLYITIKFVWFLTYIYIINTIRIWIQKPAVQAAMDGMTGAIFVAFGIKLALEKSH